MKIGWSAFNHGERAEDIEHAVRNALRWLPEEDGVTIIIGPAWNGRLMEVGVNRYNVIIHAMTARPKYVRRLR